MSDSEKWIRELFEQVFQDIRELTPYCAHEITLGNYCTCGMPVCLI